SRPEPRDDPSAWVRRLTGNGRSQPHANRRAVVLEADRGRVAHSPALVAAAMSVRKLAVGTVSRAGHPGVEGRQHPDEGIDENDNQTQDDQFHSRPQLSHYLRFVSSCRQAARPELLSLGIDMLIPSLLTEVLVMQREIMKGRVNGQTARTLAANVLLGQCREITLARR